jgi:hypothetical protein
MLGGNHDQTDWVGLGKWNTTKVDSGGQGNFRPISAATQSLEGVKITDGIKQKKSPDVGFDNIF